jgi:hypothetical protein
MIVGMQIPAPVLARLAMDGGLTKGRESPFRLYTRNAQMTP